MKIGITWLPHIRGLGRRGDGFGYPAGKRGHEVHFVSYAQPFRLAHFHERIFFHEVEMEHYPLFEYPPYTLALAVALHDAAQTHDLDLLHVHYAIPHAEAGYLYPVGDVAGMSDGARQMLNDPVLQKRFGEAGRAIAVECFSAEGVVPAYEACYERAVESHARTPERRG